MLYKIVVTKADITASKAHRTRSDNAHDRLDTVPTTGDYIKFSKMMYRPYLHCPIARAARRLYPNKEIGVSGSYMSIGEDECYLPNDARIFIGHFDDRDPVNPIEFEVCNN